MSIIWIDGLRARVAFEFQGPLGTGSPYIKDEDGRSIRYYRPAVEKWMLSRMKYPVRAEVPPPRKRGDRAGE